MASDTSAIPDLNYDGLAKDLDKKSPLEIMDNVRTHTLFKFVADSILAVLDTAENRCSVSDVKVLMA